MGHGLVDIARAVDIVQADHIHHILQIRMWGMRHDQGVRLDAFGLRVENRKIETHQLESPDVPMHLQIWTSGNTSREINLESNCIISVWGNHLLYART